MFSHRPPGESVLFVGNHGHGEKINGSVVEGGNVRMVLGREVVLIGDIKAIGPGLYRGTIDGFKSLVSECEGYLQGQTVVFAEKQIFECSQRIAPCGQSFCWQEKSRSIQAARNFRVLRALTAGGHLCRGFFDPPEPARSIRRSRQTLRRRHWPRRQSQHS